MKKGIRVAGIEDARFTFEEKKTTIYCVITRGESYIEKIRATEIKIDGTDATEKIIEMMKEETSEGQIKAIFFSSLFIGGLNYVKIEEISKKLKTPCIILLDERPQKKRLDKAIKKVKHKKEIKEYLENEKEYGEIQIKIANKESKMWIRTEGIDEKEGKEIINKTRSGGKRPEALRIAKMIGKIRK